LNRQGLQGFRKRQDRVDDSAKGNSRKSQGIFQMVSRLVGGRRKVTEEEIQDLIDAGEEEGLVKEEESEMIRAIFALGSTVVREIMIPRTEMATISVESNLRETLDAIIGCGHSRIPVYEGTIDNIIGLLYAKDLLRYWGYDDQQTRIRDILRPPTLCRKPKTLRNCCRSSRKREPTLP